jgi:hypothetical protein
MPAIQARIYPRHQNDLGDEEWTVLTLVCLFTVSRSYVQRRIDREREKNLFNHPFIGEEYISKMSPPEE